MQYWLMKSEPTEFSIDTLAKRKKTFWDGIRNYQVRNMIRDEMHIGDRALFYHSSTASLGVAGIMEIIGNAKPDPTQFDSKSKYYDKSSNQDSPRWFGVEVSFVEKFSRLVTLSELRKVASFSNAPLIKKGNRLSVMKLTKTEFNTVVLLSKKSL